MLKISVLLCCLAGALGGRLDGKIVGGLPADISQFPYQVSLRYMDEHDCGGSILNADTVLTAAHCTDGVSVKYLSVRVGNTDNRLGKSYAIKSVHQHTLYNESTYDYDISVLKIVGKFTFSKTVQPIPMIASGQSVVPGSLAVVSGWGATFEGDTQTPDDLRMVYINLISEKQCKSLYGESRITKNMLCAFTPKKDSCQGDSGGPLAQNGKLIGVVSWGIGCARPNYAGVYADVSVFNKWVQKYM